MKGIIFTELVEMVEATFSPELMDELDETETAAIQMLAMAGHYKDESTASHMQRMAAYSAALAEGLGWPAGAVRLLEKAAPLHDVGKIGIPDEILLSKDKLTDEQWIVMRSHTVIGGKHLVSQRGAIICHGCRSGGSTP